MIQTLVAVSTQARPQPDSPENELLDPLLQLAGEISTTHALVLGQNGLDLMCSLIRHGCPTATAMRLGTKPDAGAYDLVVVPHAAAISSLDVLIRQIRRALAPSGRLIAGVPNGRAATALARRLRLNGFSALGSVHLPNLTLLRADLRRL